jgi:hypothetical protein
MGVGTLGVDDKCLALMKGISTLKKGLRESRHFCHMKTQLEDQLSVKHEASLHQTLNLH